MTKTEVASHQVLIVDDNPMSRIKLLAAIRHLGHKAIAADGGASGLAMMRTERVDLILLDIMMPGIDGYQVLREMHKNPELAEIPVLVISSLDDMKEIVEAIELGAVDFLPKTVGSALLKARVSACLEKKRLRDIELAYLKDVERLTEAARIVREFDFNPARLQLGGVSDRNDPLGDLARVFEHMASEVHRREVAYRRQIDLLRGGFLLILLGMLTGLYPTLSKVLAGSEIDNPIGMTAWVATVTMSIGLSGTFFSRIVPKLTWSNLKFALVIGPFAGAFPQITLFYVSEHIPAMVMSITLAMQSLMVFLITAALRIEKPSLIRFAGLLFGLLGVALIILPSSSASGIGSPLWIMVALLVPLFYALEGITMMAMPRENTNAWELVFLTMLGSSIWAWIAALAMGKVLVVGEVDMTTATMIVTFGLVSAFGTWLLAVAVRKTGAIFASQYGYVSTVMGVVWSILLLSETATSWIWVSLGCMLVGMLLVRPRESDNASHDPRKVQTQPAQLKGEAAQSLE